MLIWIRSIIFNIFSAEENHIDAKHLNNDFEYEPWTNEKKNPL